jgi:Tfp pilus assembly protein PilO
MSSLSKREKILLWVLGFFLLGFLYYRFVATPLLIRYQSATSTLDSNKKILQNLRESEKNINNIKKQIETLNLQAEQSSKSIPDTSRVPEVVMFFKEMTESSGASVGKIGFGNPIDKTAGKGTEQGIQQDKNEDNSKAGGIIVLPMSYQVSGDYSSIISLLNKIENNSRKMVVDKLSVNKDIESGKLSANLNINCYYIKKDGPSEPIVYQFFNNSYGKLNMFN